MSRKSKFIKNYLNKQNEISKIFKKQSKVGYNLLESQIVCARHNTPKQYFNVKQKDKSFSVIQGMGEKRNVELRYCSQKKQGESEESRVKDKYKNGYGDREIQGDKQREKEQRKGRNYTSESKSKKQELMEWYQKIEKEYQTAERRFDTEMLKLNMRSSQIEKSYSRVKEQKSRIIPMATIIEQRSNCFIESSRPKSSITTSYKDIPLPTKPNNPETLLFLFKPNPRNTPTSTLILPLLSSLKHQISLQSTLRLYKHKLTPQNSFQIQKLLLQTYNILPKFSKLLPEQFDPFIKQSQPQLTNQQIARKISISHQQTLTHWHNQVKCKFTREQVEYFFTLLDFDQQSFIEMKIFVRELSIMLKMNLRKRDVLKVFERVSQEGVITLKSLQKEVGRE